MAIRSPVPGTIHLATLNGDEQVAIASGAGNVTTTTQAVANLGAATAAITQLTGDVTAGPGTGSQAATIAANAVTTTKINNAAVTYAKVQNVGASKLLGNATGAPAAAAEITLGANLSFSGSTLVASGGALPAGGSVGQPVLNTGSGTGNWGDDVFASAGNNLQLQGGADGGAGAGGALLNGGNDAGHGPGNAIVAGGSSNTTAIAGGTAALEGGLAGVGDANGGDILISPGAGHGTGRSGRLTIANATSTPGGQVGTLTNSPAAGDPTIWLEVVINTVTYYIPAWTGGA